MDRSPTDGFQYVIADLFQPQGILYHLRGNLCQLERRFFSQKVRSLEEINMECMALDILTAVHQTAQRPDLRVCSNSQGILQRHDRAHLIRDRANAADTGSDIGDFLEEAVDQEALEEARRLIDIQTDLDGLAILQSDK
jgi:hypothetical protein